MTVLAAEARAVEDELVGHQSLHGVHGLLAGGAGLLHLSPKAEGLFRERLHQGPDRRPPFLPAQPSLGALPWSAEPCCWNRRLWLPEGEGGGAGSAEEGPRSSPAQIPRTLEGGGEGGRQTGRSSSLHAWARPLRGWSALPPRLITYMGGGGLSGGSGGLEHGSLEAMAAPSGDAAPAGFCKGKSVGRALQALPSPQGGGRGVYRQGPGGLWLGLSLSHFLLLWVLPLPPLTHPPLRPLGPHAAPQGAGVPEWNHVSREERS